MRRALRLAIKRAGSKSELAKVLGVHPSAIVRWRWVPPDKCLTVAERYGLNPCDLNPVVYGSDVERLRALLEVERLQ